jgi:hypothetical protein
LKEYSVRAPFSLPLLVLSGEAAHKTFERGGFSPCLVQPRDPTFVKGGVERAGWPSVGRGEAVATARPGATLTTSDLRRWLMPGIKCLSSG